MQKIIQTQWFDAVHHTPSKNKPGRYKAKPAGAKRAVMRWWTGTGWQYNRRKANAVCGFGKRPGDKWAGAAHRTDSSLGK